MKTCPHGTTPYTIRPGDTFFLLAQRYNVTLNSILAANPGVNPRNLQIGQVVCIPGRVPVTPVTPITPMVPVPPVTTHCPEGSTIYEFENGDTLETISQLINVPAAVIRNANPTIDFTQPIHTGQEICIPPAEQWGSLQQ